MIIELLLPNSSMKKYINMVVGLLLILIFLQPLFHLFQVDVESLVDNTSPFFNTAIEDEEMKNSIELKKSEIQQVQAAYVVEEMAVQMKKQVEEGLSEQYGVAIKEISFELDKEEQAAITLESLKTIYVTLMKVDEQKMGAVQEVVISVDDPDTSEELPPEIEDITSFLYESWQLEEEDQDISILWEGGV
ncbi:stage III sporulation protein AF [Aquibacillus koreensis]|uniref:Stage III sporulation protein AF n=2 Tax=Aquibacillus koreensis TaxID=279446 RepID=A0A9X3WKI1_9BACI|nr:stage III sporulation protein AF [Aquibacillus koreensis]